MDPASWPNSRSAPWAPHPALWEVRGLWHPIPEHMPGWLGPPGAVGGDLFLARAGGSLGALGRSPASWWGSASHGVSALQRGLCCCWTDSLVRLCLSRYRWASGWAAWPLCREAAVRPKAPGLLRGAKPACLWPESCGATRRPRTQGGEAPRPILGVGCGLVGRWPRPIVQGGRGCSGWWECRTRCLGASFLFSISR